MSTPFVPQAYKNDLLNAEEIYRSVPQKQQSYLSLVDFVRVTQASVKLWRAAGLEAARAQYALGTACIRGSRVPPEFVASAFEEWEDHRFHIDREDWHGHWGNSRRRVWEQQYRRRLAQLAREDAGPRDRARA